MRTRVWAVGVFLVVGFLIFAVVLFLIGNRHKAFSRHFEVYAEFSNLDGIVKGATVRVSGLDAGQVTDIEIPSNPQSRFRLKLQLQRKVNGMVRDDSVVSIKTEGVVGNEFIYVQKGSEHSPEAASGITLPSKEPVDFGAMLEKGSGMLNDVQGTIKDIHGKVDVALDSITKTVNHTDGLITGVQGNIKKVASDSSQITGTINEVLQGIQQGKGPAGMLLKDQDAANRLRATLDNAQQTTANLNQASAKITGVISDFQSRDLSQKAEAAIVNVRDLSKQLNDTLTEALAQDRIGQTGAANLRSTLSNLNQGTANLAEDTEALKHEFFFRGFFKKRGYYSLQDISADQYRSNRKLAKQINTRKWLAAPKLFEMEPDGKERLSAGGRNLVDQTVAQFIGSLPNHPMIIEGYSGVTGAGKQYLQGRERAILIRDYLEQHFHVSYRYVGIVSLNSTPPAGSGVSSWDGICVTILD